MVYDMAYIPLMWGHGLPASYEATQATRADRHSCDDFDEGVVVQRAYGKPAQSGGQK